MSWSFFCSIWTSTLNQFHLFIWPLELCFKRISALFIYDSTQRLNCNVKQLSCHRMVAHYFGSELHFLSLSLLFFLEVLTRNIWMGLRSCKKPVFLPQSCLPFSSIPFMSCSHRGLPIQGFDHDCDYPACKDQLLIPVTHFKDSKNVLSFWRWVMTSRCGREKKLSVTKCTGGSVSKSVLVTDLLASVCAIHQLI